MLAWLSMQAVAQQSGGASWSGALHVRACPASERTLPADLPAVLQTVVVIRRGDGLGSGVLVSPDGFVATAAHVVGDASTVQAELPNGVHLPADVIRADEARDLALLHIPGSGYPCLAGWPAPDVGAELYVVGSPLSPELGATVTRGIVSGLRVVEGQRLLQTDASINLGNSGGPLVDARGYVVGIVAAKLVGETVEGIGFGVPWDQLSGTLDLLWSDQSDADLAGLVGRRTRAPPAVPAPSKPAGTPPALFAPSVPPLPSGRFDPVLLGSGGALAFAGWTTVGVTSIWYAAAGELPPSAWRQLQVANALGWAAAAGGSAMIVVATTSKADGPAIGVQGRW